MAIFYNEERNKPTYYCDFSEPNKRLHVKDLQSGDFKNRYYEIHKQPISMLNATDMIQNGKNGHIKFKSLKNELIEGGDQSYVSK